MAITNHDRAGKAVELLRAGLAPYVEREHVNAQKGKTQSDPKWLLSADDRNNANRPIAQWDAAVLLKVMWDSWNDIFGRTLGRAERSLVQELREVRIYFFKRTQQTLTAFVVERGDGAAKFGDGLRDVFLLARQRVDALLCVLQFFLRAQIHWACGFAFGF